MKHGAYQISTKTSDVGPGFSAEAGTFTYGKAASEGTCPTAKSACKREGPCFVGAFVLAFAFVLFRSVSHDIPVPDSVGGSGDGLATAAEWYHGNWKRQHFQC